MRIAVISESFLPTVNGVTNSVLRVLEHLERTGHEAMVIAPGEGITSYAGAPVVRVPSVSLPRYASFPLGLPTNGVVEVLADYAPDVIHLASPFFLGAHGSVLSRRLNIPSVAVFQTDVAAFLKTYHARGISRAVWRWMRQAHNNCDLTLAPSSAVCDELEARGFHDVRRWGRGVDAERFNPKMRSPYLRARIAPNDEVVIVYIDTVAHEKRVEQLVALRDIPGTRIAIVGDGPMRGSLQRQLPNATFLGHLDGDDLAAAFASLDVFVHPGPHETFCQSAQEALSSGLPVIAPAAGGLLDLVSPGKNGYLTKPLDAEGMRAAASTLAFDEALRLRMSGTARRSVLARTWPAICDQLIGYYAEAINARADRRSAAVEVA